MAAITKWSTVAIADIKPYKNNAKLHDKKQVQQIADSIKEFGFVSPCIIDADYNLIAGHGRIEAAKLLGMTEVPAVFVEGLTDAQRRAYILADNRLTELAHWDDELVSFELAALKDESFDISVTGFTIDDINFDTLEDDGDTLDFTNGESSDPSEEKEPRIKRGEVWQLGDHRLMCGDSTDARALAVLMDGQKADLVFTDPPYGMKKESDGVTNDNLNKDDLLRFNQLWIPLTFDALKDNGSWYCWGTDEPLMDIYSNILKPMIKDQKITFRNLLTWDKSNAQGQLAEDFRSYATADEKCLFVMCGVQGFNNNADNYFEGFEPIRQYIDDNIKKLNKSDREIADALGFKSAVMIRQHWRSKSQWTFISSTNYEALKNYAQTLGVEIFPRSYEDIRQEYEDIRQEWYDTRAYFNNTHDNMNSVWHFAKTEQEERSLTGGHATPKPLALCRRAIKSSSREGELVLDVFGGSGSTLIACEQLGRKCRMMELEPKWCEVIIHRWEYFTGQTARKIA